MIKIQHLSKSYGSKEVLKHVSLNFENGKVYGIVGENGAGKTTFFRCISGLEDYKGTIISDEAPLKDHLGLLLAEPFYFSKITGREYLQLLCNARSVTETNFDERNIFDLPLEQYASTYSTGMKKKLAITGLLLQGNCYFILDEPFNGVDIQSNMIIMDIIHKLKSLNKIVIISSHIFSTLKDTCDEIHLLKNGQFEEAVQKEQFHELEAAMKDGSTGNKIDKLGLK